MFNRRRLTTQLIMLSICAILFNCSEEVKLEFSEATIETSDAATIAVNYPKADGTSDLAKQINTHIQTYIAQQIYMGETVPKELSIEEAIAQFNSEYTSFKEEFPEGPEMWEALIDGEVTYKSDDLVSIAITSYLDTGGAHGNTYIYFLNFDGQTGSPLKTNQLITNKTAFSKVVEAYLGKETKTVMDENAEENYFFGEAFKLPESIGFSEEGVIIVYNPYEIAAYAQGPTEFTVPFEEVSDFLAFDF